MILLEDRRWCYVSVRLLIGVGVAGALALCLWLVHLSGDRETRGHPASSGEAEAVANWMDERLDALWVGLGVLENNVRRVHLLAQESEGESWGLRVLEVQLPFEVSSHEAAGSLDGLRQDEQHAVRILRVTVAQGFLAVDLWVDGFLTHRILLKEAAIEAQPIAPEPRRPQLALIVDDLGNTYEPIRPLFRMGAPFTVSIFPHRPFSRRIAQEAQSSGLEIMMHLPMEPWGYPEKNPGVGALLVDMSDQELERVLMSDIRNLPNIRGVNNHMGSRFTECRDPMVKIMKTLATNDLYFVDSLTTPKSVGFYLAQKMGVRTHKRDVFLDVVQEEGWMRTQFRKFLRVARFQGYAVGICHPYPKTIQILPEFFEKAEDQGFQWVVVSQLHRVGSEPSAEANQ